MVLASLEHALVPKQGAVCRDQIVREKRNGAASHVIERIDLELDVQVRFGGKFLGESAQRRSIDTLVPETISSDKHIKFQIVVGSIPLRRAQYATFAAAIATSQH